MKRFVKRILGSLLAVIMIAGMFPAYADAAASSPSYRICRFAYGDWGEPERVKVYGNYYWNDSTSIYCSSTSDGEGKAIATAPEGYMIDDTFITNGIRIYYDIKPEDYSKAETVLYYVPNSGKTKPVKVRALKSNSWLCSYYPSGSRLYTYKYSADAGCYQLYSLNVKTKQYKRVNSNFRVIGATGGSRYIYGAPLGTGSQFVGSMKIYDAKAGKVIRTIKPAGGKYSRIEQAHVSGGRLYYLETGSSKTTVFETSLSGKTTPKAVFREAAGASIKFAGGKLYYSDPDGNYFTFDLKTKEKKPISSDTYDSVMQIFS